MPRAAAVVVFTVVMPSFSTCTGVAAGSAPFRMSTAIEAGVPVYTAADSLVRDGGLATTGVNYTKLGELTAQMAADVLNGADPAATPVQVLNDGITTVNTTTAAALGIDPEIFDLTGEGYIAVE